MAKKEVINRNLRLKTSVVKDVEVLAEQENRSFNNMVETLLIQQISKIKQTK